MEMTKILLISETYKSEKFLSTYDLTDKMHPRVVIDFLFLIKNTNSKLDFSFVNVFSNYLLCVSFSFIHCAFEKSRYFPVIL